MKSLSELQKKFVKRILELDKSKVPIFLDKVLVDANLLPTGMYIGIPEIFKTPHIYYNSFELENVKEKYLPLILEIIEITIWLDKSSYIIVEKSLNNNTSIGEFKADYNNGWMNIDNDLILKGLREYFSGQRIYVTQDLRQFRKDNFLVKEEKYLSINKRISICALVISILAILFTAFVFFYPE